MSRSYLKNVDQARGQGVDPELAVGGAGRSAVAQRAMAGQAKKRSIHGGVCEHFEPTCNTAIGPQTGF